MLLWHKICGLSFNIYISPSRAAEWVGKDLNCLEIAFLYEKDCVFLAKTILYKHKWGGIPLYSTFEIQTIYVLEPF